MKRLFNSAALRRAGRTILQAGASAALVAIGSAKTIGDVNWVTVISTASLAAIMSLLTSASMGLPESEKEPSETA